MKRLLATFMVACAVSASGQGLTDSLIAHFPFDSSASALIGLLEPTDTIVGLSFCADAVGTPNSALCFDGSSLLSYGDVLDLGTEDFAVSFWFYLDTVSGLGPNEARRLVNKGGTFAGNPPNAGWMTNFEQVSPGNYTFEFSFNDGITFPVDSIEVPVSLDEWYQAVFTRCGQQHMLYLNCLPVDSFITTAGLNLDVSTYFALGGLDRRPGQNSQDGFFEGALDELRVYRGRCLDLAEIQSLCTELTLAVEPVERPSSCRRLALAPNPARAVLTISGPALDGSAPSLSVYDVFGRSVIVPKARPDSLTGSTTIELGIAELKPGAYFVILQGSQWQAHGRFIKE